MAVIELDAALALIKDENGKLLAQLRNDPTFPNSHNKWELPGGKIDPGETADQAVVREAKEETGLDVEVLDSYSQQRLEVDNNNEGDEYRTNLFYFHCRVVGGELYNPSIDPKIFRASFFTTEELENLIWGSDNDKNIALEFSKQ